MLLVKDNHLQEQICNKVTKAEIDHIKTTLAKVA